MAATVIPAALLSMLEGGLRWCGAGESMSFTRPVERGGVEVMEPNPAFGRRFFPKEMAREAAWFAYPVKKDPETIRIFVLGGSAAQGDPEPALGLARVLETLLEARHPDQDFEVINAAMTAINSHVVRDIAAEVVEHDADLLVVYMGNNEVVGPFGAGNPMVPMIESMAMIRTSLFLKSTRVGQMMQHLIGAVMTDEPKNAQWRGMEMFLDQAVAADDPRLEVVYGHFRSNLQAILEEAGDEEVPVLLSTVAVNLRDCAPFGSRHRPGLSADELKLWRESREKGIAAYEAGDFQAAHGHLLAALAIDDRHAELHYLLGQALLELDRPQEARKHLGLARDLDTLRFRADHRINTIIRDVAKNAGEGVVLVDGEGLLGKAAHGMPGRESFYEHVHLTLHGNYGLAAGMVEAIEKKLGMRLGKVETALPDEEDCRQLMACTDFDQLMVLRSILGRMELPPFTAQVDIDEQITFWQAKLQALDKQLRQPGGFTEGAALYEQALAKSPDDPWLNYRHGFFQLNGSGDFKGAETAFRRVQNLGMESPELWLGIGMARYQQGRSDVAVKAFREGLALDPDHWKLLSQLGFTLNLLGKSTEAIDMCSRAVDLAPERAEAHDNLGLVLMDNGKLDQAKDHLKKSIELAGETAKTLANLGVIATAQGDRDVASAYHNRALELDPMNFKANRELGGVRLQAGDWAAALNHFDRAHQARPNDFSCANNLAWLLATVPDDAWRNGQRAVGIATRLAEATAHRDASVLDTLAAALAEAGQMDAAVSTAAKALDLAAGTELEVPIRTRLILYRQGIPYREGK